MRVSLHPLEVVGLSLLGPATLLLLFHFLAPGTGSGPPDAGPATDPGRSRTRPIRVFAGEVEGWGRVRVFPGLTPGLGFGLPLAQARRRLGLEEGSRLFTLLLSNDGDEPRRPAAGAWRLSQAGGRVWDRREDLSALPQAPLFTTPGRSLPPRRVARFLFAGKSRPAGTSLLFSGPGGVTRLEPVTMPAQEVFRF